VLRLLRLYQVSAGRAELRLADPSIDELDVPTREAIARHWEHRAGSEQLVAVLFSSLAVELRQIHAEDVVISLAMSAAEDEVRHAEICREVASRYAGRLVVLPLRESPAHHAHHEPELQVALDVAALCCIQETIACAWMQACRAGATAPLVRASLGDLLQDETDHARLGWAHLASAGVTAEVRAQVATHLSRMFEACLQPWLAPDVSGLPDGIPAHGIPSDEETRRVVLGCVRDVILPGLTTVGVSTVAALRWFASADGGTMMSGLPSGSTEERRRSEHRRRA
jgi:hypothetical protein